MKIIGLLVALSATTVYADKHAPIKNGTYTSQAAAWNKLNVQGIKLGQPLAQPGFTCGAAWDTHGAIASGRACVKFLDARCKGKSVLIYSVHGKTEPNACVMDENAGGTFLDGKQIFPPLQAIRIVGTDTTAPLIQQISYRFAGDDITDTSNIGKALLAKYGEPDYRNPPNRFMWRIGDTELTADCRTTQGADYDYCEILVSDNSIRDNEGALQKQADDAARIKAAPPAPNL